MLKKSASIRDSRCDTLKEAQRYQRERSTLASSLAAALHEDGRLLSILRGILLLFQTCRRQ